MFKKIHDRMLHKIVDKTNPYLGSFRRKFDGIDSDASNFTIISNNCWAGSVYRWYNLPYLTPTAGLYFYAKDYIRFLSNLRYYTSLKPEQIPLSKSKYESKMIEKGQNNVPIGLLDDVEIMFLHYPTFEEAQAKWIRRAKRINWDNLIIKNAEMNGCTEHDVKSFDLLKFSRKFIFTTRDYGLDSQIVFKEYIGKEQVIDDTTLFNKYVNLKNMILGKPFKKNN